MPFISGGIFFAPSDAGHEALENYVVRLQHD